MAAWVFPNKLFNFRANGAFVTDLTDEQGISGNAPTNYGNYPKALSGFVGQGAADTVQAGWNNVGNIGTSDSNATPTEGIEFAGNERVTNNVASNPQQYRVDLPLNGTFQISVAFGSCSGSTNNYYSILDGTTVIAGPFGPVACNTSNYAGADGNIVATPASYAAWVASTFVLQRTFTDNTGGVSRLFINIGDPAHAATGSTLIAHLRIVQGAAGPPPPQLLYAQRKILYFI